MGFLPSHHLDNHLNGNQLVQLKKLDPISRDFYICRGKRGRPSERPATLFGSSYATAGSDGQMVVELKVDVIPVWDDNYVFAVCLPESVWIIDPADFSTVDCYLKRKDLTPTTILNTHHHFDHVGGNEDFKKAYDLEIWANVNDKARIPGHTKTVTPGQSYLLDGVNIEVIDVPGHTIGHIAYFLPDHKILLRGIPFSLGCGRLFEGTPAQMLSSLSLQIPAVRDYGMRHMSIPWLMVNLLRQWSLKIRIYGFICSNVKICVPSGSLQFLSI